LTVYEVWNNSITAGEGPGSVAAMWDERHFFDWVYRGLNEALLIDLLC
jgi:hypothetical protein